MEEVNPDGNGSSSQHWDLPESRESCQGSIESREIRIDDEDEQKRSCYAASEIAGRFIEVVIDPAKAHVDTAAPIDSVKGAVCRFGGILDWRERRMQIQDELDKVHQEASRYPKKSQEAVEAMKDLESTWRVADELRQSVEKAQAEAAQARREAEVALRELQSASLEKQREAGKAVEELVALKGALESSHAAHVEAEERRVAVAAEFEQDKSQWQSELEEAEQEAKKLREELMAACDLEVKVEAASEQLESLKAELMVLQKQAMMAEVKESIDKARKEAEHLRFAAASMRDDLQRKKAELAALQSKEGSIASLEEELNRATSELAAAAAEEEVQDDSDNKKQEARREAEEAKAKARSAREEVDKAGEEVSLAKAAVAATEARLEAVTREIVAANTSEEMATASANALLLDLQLELMTLTREEYEELSRRAAEMEEAAGKRVVEAVKLIEEAKDAEVRSLEKLTRAARQTEQRRQALQAATEEAEQAEFAKLSAERELRQWRADHDQPRAGLAEISVLDDPSSAGNPHILSPRGGYMMPPRNEVMEAAEARQKKTTFFPRMVTFLARKRAQNWK